MTKIWFPQRDALDSSMAVLKTFIHHINYKISRSTIEETVRSHAEFPSLSFKAIIEILQDWGINAIAYKISCEHLTQIPIPSITLINEEYRGIKMGIPIVFFEIVDDQVLYCHPRKGWVYEELSAFETKWCEYMISIKGIEENGESDYIQREEAYEEDKLNLKDSSIVKLMSKVLNAPDCDYLIKISEDRFAKSMAGAVRELNIGRTSYSAYLNFDNDHRLNKIREELSELLKIDLDRFEYFQCVSYTPSQEYQAHYDTFETDSEAGNEEIKSGGQRQHTLLIYLNDDFEGGQTFFPHLDILCSPRKGNAVFFNSTNGNGEVIKASFHAGLPVSRGRKYALNLWIREERIN